MTPTDEQLHILDLARSTSDNLLLNALAGSGKTSTLELIEGVVKTKPILYLVFNKRNAEEAEKRMASTTTVRTFNSLGHRIWAKAQYKRLTVQPRKTQEIARAIIEEIPKADRGPLWSCYWEACTGVALAKALGYIPSGKFPTGKRLIDRESFHHALDETPDDLTADFIDKILTRSIASAFEGYIDYNDQIYMPALFGGTFPRFPLVLVDEAQDLSPVNHAMLERLCKHRVIAVGDPWQNIYGFRGASASGMSQLQAKYSMTPCDLSVSFRCPRAIVEAARWRVPHFKWIKEGGHVETLPTINLGDVDDNATFLSRNNAPLLSLAFRLLSSGRSCRMAGSDIGPKLVGLMRKLGDGTLSRKATLVAIAEWETARLDKGSKSAEDLAACMRVFANHGHTLDQAVSYAEHLFSQSGSIKLMTAHKSKGLEFPLVYHLDPWMMKETEQDKNLRYVAITRSEDRYFEIDTEGLR